MNATQVGEFAFKNGEVTHSYDGVSTLVHIYRMSTKEGMWYIATLDDLSTESAYGVGANVEEALRDASKKYVARADEELMKLGDPFEKAFKAWSSL